MLTDAQKALADMLPQVILKTLEGRTRVVRDDEGNEREVREGPEPKDIENAIKYLAAHGITKMPTGHASDALTNLAARAGAGSYPFPVQTNPLPPVSEDADKATG